MLICNFKLKQFAYLKYYFLTSITYLSLPLTLTKLKQKKIKIHGSHLFSRFDKPQNPNNIGRIVVNGIGRSELWELCRRVHHGCLETLKPLCHVVASSGEEAIDPSRFASGRGGAATATSGWCGGIVRRHTWGGIWFSWWLFC